MDDDPTLWASMTIEVGSAPVRDVEVVLQRGARVSGRVDWSGLTTPRITTEQLGRILVRFEPADGRAALSQAVVRPDGEGRFRSPQLPPGKYVIRVSSAPGVWAAIHDGREVSVAPLDVAGRDLDGLIVALVDKAAELTGVVRRSDGGPNDEAAVIAFWSQRETWTDYGRSPRHLLRVRAGRDGAYSFAGLLPGAYHVVAVPDDGSTAWLDPKYLERLAAGARVIRVSAGERALLDLGTTTVR
jgi:hypothetical protein